MRSYVVKQLSTGLYLRCYRAGRVGFGRGRDLATTFHSIHDAEQRIAKLELDDDDLTIEPVEALS